MTATGARRGHLVYHWKHGWIPLDHFAALSKAKGSHKTAEKIMQKHGIAAPGHHSAAQQTHPVGAWVRATQPGLSHETHGQVVGHTDSGMLRVQHQNRLGKSQVGTFNPSHTTVVAQEAGKRRTSAGANFRAEQAKAAAAAAHPAPHTLKVGDRATVAGVDEHGAPIHFTGEVRGTTAVTATLHGKKTPMLGITVKRESPTTGAMRHDTVYVPDPNRDPAKIDAARKAGAARDQLRRDLNAKYAGRGLSYMRQVHGIDPAAMSTTDLAKYRESLHAEHDHVLLSDGKKLRDKMDAEHAKRTSTTSRPVGIMGRPSALDSMPTVAPRNAQMRGEHAVTAKEAAANRAAMKDMSKRAEDALKAAQKDSTGKELLGHATKAQGTSARAAIVRAAEDVGQGNHDQARQRLETALADTRAMGPAYPGDRTHTADTRALSNALKVLGGEKAGSGHAKRSTEARVRSLPPEGKFGGVHSETHMGEKITVRKGKQWGTLQAEINGQHVGTPYGLKNSDAVKELDSLKATIEHARANPGSYTNGAGEHSYGMKLTPKVDPHAARAAQLREAAAKKRAEAERIAGSVGAPDRAGAMLRAKDSARMNARMDSGLRRYTEKQREASALESKARLADGRAKSAAEKRSAADLALTPSKLSRGDLIQHKGQAHMVTKVNKTTVSVPSVVGGSWEDKVPIGGISQHVKLSDMKDSTLRTLMSRAKGNDALQAIYAAELKRRGLA